MNPSADVEPVPRRIRNPGLDSGHSIRLGFVCLVSTRMREGPASSEHLPLARVL
jgi:hypothetical protein